MRTREVKTKSSKLAPVAALALTVAALVLAVAAGSLSIAAAGQPQTDKRQLKIEPSTQKSASLSPESRARVRQAIAAVGLVMVRRAGEPSGRGLRPRGSAVIVRDDGLVVTNYHVILDDRTNELFDQIVLNLSADGAATASPQNQYRLKAVLINKDYDIALLRVESDGAGNPLPSSLVFPSVELADSRKAQLLDDLTIIGFPEKGGLSVTVSRGVIEGKDVLGNWIKTDARLIHGNSGGAAVNSEGRLIGIPTKVLADIEPIDKDGDGFPDGTRTYGAVGFLRPSHLVSVMIEQLGTHASNESSISDEPKQVAPPAGVTVRGVVRSGANGRPVVGASVGLVPLGTGEVTATNLLTWGSTNAAGQFALSKPVPPGRYTLRAKAIGYQAHSEDVQVEQNAEPITIVLRAFGVK